MYIVQSSRLLTKLVALAALTISISYLHKPEALYALTCRQQCQAFLKSCLAGCGTNSICQERCISSYKNCVTGCP
jgi:hypothetical protein